jgi:hypothetical protein
MKTYVQHARFCHAHATICSEEGRVIAGKTDNIGIQSYIQYRYTVLYTVCPMFELSLYVDVLGVVILTRITIIHWDN